jgi:outer membrane protein assembly factor BamD
MKKIFFILFLLVSCAPTQQYVYSYDDAMEELKNGNYLIAAERFEEADSQNPFTSKAANGFIMSAYSYYKAGEYEESLRVIDYLLGTNPMNENLPYIYYLRAINYESQITSIRRARDIIEDSILAFYDVLNKFPNSIYGNDASLRISKLKGFLAENEIFIGDFYLNDRNYIGAINHYKKVLEYDTNHREYALFRLMEINNFLNLKIETAQYYALLYKDFPNSTYLKQ